MRELLKRSRSLHATYKLVRRIPEAPPTAWLDVRRTHSIFRVLPNTMLPAPRLINAYDCMRAIEREHIPGDVAECGVWAGGAVGLMATVNKHHGSLRRFHLFDSFEGLPQPSEHDLEVLPGFQEQHPGLQPDTGDGELVAIDACVAPLEACTELFFDILDFDRDRTVIHKGWFQDTIPAAKDTIGPLALLRVDGDWYESTRVCLDGLYDKVVPGGFVIVDDYGTFTGCRRAVDEFLASRRLDIELEHIDGEGVFFRKPVQSRNQLSADCKEPVRL